MARKTLTKTEARALAYVYESGGVEDYKIARYLGIHETEPRLQTLLGGLVRRRYLKRTGQMYRNTSKGQRAAEQNAYAILARVEMAQASAENAYSEEKRKFWSEYANELAATAKARNKPKTTTTTPAKPAKPTEPAKPAKPTEPAKPKPLTTKQRSWLSWLFRGDPRVKR